MEEDLKFIYDTRSSELRSPNSFFPPFPLMVLNAAGERIPFVFYVDPNTSRIGFYQHRKNEEGKYILACEADENGRPCKVVEQYITLPGFQLVRIGSYNMDNVSMLVNNHPEVKKNTIRNKTEFYSSHDDFPTTKDQGDLL